MSMFGHWYGEDFVHISLSEALCRQKGTADHPTDETHYHVELQTQLKAAKTHIAQLVKNKEAEDACHKAAGIGLY